MESGLTREKLLSELVKSPHRNLSEYLPVGNPAAANDPEFFAHLVAWNRSKGSVKDSHVALPAIALNSALLINGGEVLVENALAHLATLPNRELLRAYSFMKESKLNGRRQRLVKLLRRYLDNLERNRGRWERVALQHRRTLKNLYKLAHFKQSEYCTDVLFKGLRPPGSIFEIVANLNRIDGVEAAGLILRYRIPFLVASPALGAKLQDKNVLLALMERMTPAEITSHMKMLERLGVRKDSALRGALEKALQKVQDSKSNALKITQAAEAVEDEDLATRLRAVQEKKLDKSSIEGDWLVLADKSSSMHTSIEVSRRVAAVLARAVNGKVHVVFFDEGSTYYDMSGKSLEEITRMTSFMRASGNTSIGTGVDYAMAKNLNVDGIALVSDGGENRAPFFADAYLRLAKARDRRPPVYLFHVDGQPDVMSQSCQRQGIEVVKFDIPRGMDYYSLPNLIQMMRTNRYSLVDEVMETPLLTFGVVFKDLTLSAQGT